MALKVSDLVSSMVKAAQASLGKDWPKARDFARPEIDRLARTLRDITQLAAAGKVNKQQARALLAIHKNTAQTVLLTIEGLGIIAAENAINAALAAVKEAVNAAAGVAIV